MHYVGTLESDASEFDSSRARNKPFEFTLGKGQDIKGWDLGVASMKKGELAKFTLAPEFAYGDITLVIMEYPVGFAQNAAARWFLHMNPKWRGRLILQIL